VFLFEEFVPLEYRQQLFAGVQNKRTLTSFFSPGKTKQWKQAATLNGRPYVVGHVPRSMNSREAEFEGLLRGNNSSTKVISLGRDGPVKRDITHPGSGPPGSSQGPSSGHTRPEISSPLFLAPREETTPRPSTPVVQTGTQASVQPTGSGNKRRFRLPTGLPRSPHPRTSGLTPSQAEDVEFETRLASYSDDELNSINANSRKGTKEERRRSKDDAWVDILVASHSRRAGNQDAELRRPGGPRPRNANRQDPEVASQEVAQVLAGIRGPSPPFDGESVDIEPMNVPHRSRMDSTGTALDEIYAPTIPGSVDLAEPQEVQVPAPPRPQRRMGYFDLHPERRHMQVGGDGGDMLDEFAQAAGGMETPPRRSDTTESVYSSGPTPPASPKQALTRLNTERLHPNPAVSTLSPPSPVPAETPSPQTPTYTQRDLQRQQEVRDRLSGKPGPKASSLIEMYREKERQAASSKGSPGKSAGTSSQELPTQPPALVVKDTAPLAPSPPQLDLSLSALDFPGMEQLEEDELEGDGEDYVEPPNFELDHGRDSPFRYIHGAPLHNVVEEEEEE